MGLGKCSLKESPMSDYVPTPYVAPYPNSESLGASIFSLVENMRAEDIQPILKKHGLESITADQWYPLQSILDALKDIVESKQNVLEDMSAIGIRTGETYPFPPEINSIEAALLAINAGVRATTRGIPEQYGIIIENIGEKHLLIKNNIPFPLETLHGYLWGLASRFKAPDEIFRLEILPEEPGKPTVISLKYGLQEDLEDE
jgi:hypothetical protein